MAVIAPNPVTHQLVLNHYATYLDTYAKALSAVYRRNRWNTALAGNFDQVMWVNEGLRDSGVCIDARILSGAPSVYSKDVPLESLKGSDFDLLLVGGNSIEEEGAYLNQILGRLRADPTRIPPIYLCQKILGGSLEALSRIQELRTCLNPKKLAFVTQMLACTPLSGSVAECGVFQGGTTVLMAMLLSLWGDQRPLYAFDTFEGMPAPTAKDGQTVYQAGTFADSPLERFSQYTQQHGMAGRITAHKGLVQDTLPRALRPGEKVSFALVDTDQYAGTVASLRTIVPILETNGVIIVDDYDLKGVKEAIAEASAEFPTLRGTELTFNFYMLWNNVNHSFLSAVQL